MVVGTLRIVFHLKDNHSLKEKRRIAKSISAKIRNRFNASVAEVGSNDKWQILELGIVTVGNDRKFVDSSLSHISEFIESLYLAPVLSTEMEILSL